MADIFLSYSREDRPRVEPLTQALAASGYQVWWDRNLAGGSRFLEETESELSNAKAVLVVWSKTSVTSHWVADEASAARDTGRLVPITFDGSIPPLGFRQFQVMDFTHWKPGDEATMAELRSALARLVKPSDPARPASVPAARKSIPKHTLVIGGVVVAALLAAAGLWVLRPKPQAPVQEDRVAFFGFTAEDAAVTDIARSATDETFEGLRAAGAAVVARSDTLATSGKARLDRATDLGAGYALGGEARSEAATGNITFAVRVEDVSTRTTLFEQTFEGPASAPLPLAVRVASMSTQVASCLSMASRMKGVPSGREWLPALSHWCATFGFGDMESVRATRELVRQAPGMPFAHSILAIVLGFNLASSATPEQMLAEAQAALARAHELDEDPLLSASGTFVVAAIRQRPLAELESILKSGLHRAPAPWERIQYQTTGVFYAGVLSQAGRIRDALVAYKDTAGVSRFGTGALWGYANTLALIGNGEANDLFEQNFSRFPSNGGWEAWIRSAIFLAAADAEKLLAEPHPPVSETVMGCWRDISIAYRTKQTAARAKGIERVKACADSRSISLGSAFSSLAALGDVDGAFAIASRPGVFTIRETPAPLFWPQTAAMRVDARFLPLVQSLGLMDYWKTTGTRPDVCQTESAPFCAAIDR
jgi:hypothetical protein